MPTSHENNLSETPHLPCNCSDIKCKPVGTTYWYYYLRRSAVKSRDKGSSDIAQGKAPGMSVTMEIRTGYRAALLLARSGAPSSGLVVATAQRPARPTRPLPYPDKPQAPSLQQP
ncbi:hypothetical protein ASPZODRAFT_142523 [Penicilliopsis zonata CBS 506.65]|uniref:Uncharacterized protein n=1 Tax=Penicilliopsis zonata CBS 506.65 TaxID=1073090 RepID=A0A1L9SHP0_9EURO|nr:hypothetical protein ASPZODRAFT_142523 [Penicilliopsis zonata CBS 506.65]OJJ46725.1 hypothetical protein ASPZODRAFT_142523 [Penicilliopsis zonata CBS 506.65]